MVRYRSEESSWFSRRKFSKLCCLMFLVMQDIDCLFAFSFFMYRCWSNRDWLTLWMVSLMVLPFHGFLNVICCQTAVSMRDKNGIYPPCRDKSYVLLVSNCDVWALFYFQKNSWKCSCIKNCEIEILLSVLFFFIYKFTYVESICAMIMIIIRKYLLSSLFLLSFYLIFILFIF